MSISLDGRVAVVTGGAQGIGLAIACRFVRAGATVLVADINPPPEGEGLLYQQTDVTDEESVRVLVERAAAIGGGLKIMVNNAGIAVEMPLEKTPLSDWQRVMMVNVQGVFLCSKYAIPAMRQSGGGAIVNIGSIEGLAANPLHSVYAASKSAVHALTRNTALEGGVDNIRCNAIAPGWIETPFNDELIAKYPDPEKARMAIEQLHPVKRLGKPDDIAAVALWLASDESAFASGQIYIHDGGRIACLPLPPL